MEQHTRPKFWGPPRISLEIFIDDQVVSFFIIHHIMNQQLPFVYEIILGPTAARESHTKEAVKGV